MAVEYLKRGKPEADRAEDDAKVRATVEEILKDIETRGDTAVREYSEKFDKYSPTAFRLSPAEIDALVAEVSSRDLEDIKFAQAQVRNFAQAQRDSMKTWRPSARRVAFCKAGVTSCRSALGGNGSNNGSPANSLRSSDAMRTAMAAKGRGPL